MPDQPDSQTEFDLGGFAPYRVALAAQLLSEALAREYRPNVDITSQEWRVLAHLASANKVSVRDIEKEIVMEKSKVSRTVSRLVDRDLVSRTAHPTDKRLVELSLTTKGRGIMAELLPMAARFQKRVEEMLGEDYDRFDSGLQQILKEYRGVE